MVRNWAFPREFGRFKALGERLWFCQDGKSSAICAAFRRTGERIWVSRQAEVSTRKYLTI